MKHDKTKLNKTVAIVVVCLLVFCMVAVLSNALSLGELPASFIGAAMGAVITAVITGILLEGQSKADELKERNVKVFAKKSKIFQAYIKQAWEVWADQKVTAEEYQKLTAKYYSSLMIFLPEKSADKIRQCLLAIGDCIDKESFENYKKLRDNIIGIINTLSAEIDLGGKIDVTTVDALDSKMFPVIFKKDFIKTCDEIITESCFGMFSNSRLRIYPSSKAEFLLYDFKKYPGCQIAIGPLNKGSPLELRLQIDNSFHQFDQYRTAPKKYSYWIKTRRPDADSELFLNSRLPKDEESQEIEADFSLEIPENKITAFGFDHSEGLEQFRVNYREISRIIAQRAAYYLQAKTIGRKFSILELVENGFTENNDT
jgi:hypothetical protein